MLAARYTNWRLWLRGQSPLQKLGPVAFVSAYWLLLESISGFRADHLFMGLILLLLSYSGPAAYVLFRFLLPLLLTGIVWDSQRFFGDLIRGTIHVAEPYQLEKRWFGIVFDGKILTPNEWFQLHTTAWLDLITGFAYLVFFTVFTLIAAYFRFYLSRKGTAKMSPAQTVSKSSRMMWAFLWLNLLGMATYYIYAAAPPWYVALYGLGPAKLGTPASPAGCLRFDQLLGVHVFSGMYGKASDVFAAIPSLHVAYPLLATYFAFTLGAGRVFCLLFYFLMCFSAVYLNHHYILDILLGSIYALGVGWLVNLFYDRRASSGHREGAQVKFDEPSSCKKPELSPIEELV